MNLQDHIEQVQNEFNTAIESCHNVKDIQDVQIHYLGRKAGVVTNLFKELGVSAVEDRPSLGQQINDLKEYVTKSLVIREQIITEKLEKKTFVDLSLPGNPEFIGRLHPLTLIQNEIISVFEGMGFEVATGPDIETDYYNFEALNMPKDHPARDLQDTFYLEDGNLLRTHTSPVQIRVMEKTEPPIRIISPGRVYRKDTPDATHSPVFHQLEGLYVDEGVTLAELKGALLAFAQALFGQEMKIRFRSGFFPFTEPSVEYDFSCIICDGKGCSTCKDTGWVEISGAGMVDPAVFEFVGYDHEKYTGYAWGMGVERIAMMKYRINDIRLFYENDIRFLEQFS